MIYEPAEDSFLLLSFVKMHARGIVLDMGCGSGMLAKEAMKHARKIVAADIDEEAVECCRKQGINAVRSDLFSNIGEKFDLIIFNPPYLPKDEKEDKKTAVALSGGKKGHEIINRFLQEAKNHLNKNGRILIVASSLTGDVEKLFKKHGYKFKLLKEESYFFEKLKVYLLAIKVSLLSLYWSFLLSCRS